MPHLIKVLFVLMTVTLSSYSYAQCDLVPKLCDIDGDRDVDQSDIDTFILLNGTTVDPTDIRDLDGDGMISTQDARECVSYCPVTANCAVPKPNILLIMADDLGYNDLAINNDNTAIDR